MKVSVSLTAELVSAVDRQAARDADSRSGVMERWLREAARRSAERDLATELRAYYESLSPAEQAEDEAWASAGLEAWIERERREGHARRLVRRGRSS
jgi:metal-responsive CopG/Arc/MetJ family transcriptional regulator